MSKSVKFVKIVTPIAFAIALSACGGGGSGADFGSGGGSGSGTTGDTGGDTTEVSASSIELSVSSRQLPSDGSTPITITAIAKDQNNNAIDGADIIFSVDKDATIIQNATVTTAADSTDTTTTQLTTVVTAGSIQTATLTPGSNTNQTLIVSVVSGGSSKSISVEVVGTTVSIEGPSGVTIDKENPFLIKLKDSSNNPIAFQEVVVTSAKGNSITTDSNFETDASGEIAFNLNSSVSGIDTISANVLGATFDKVINISSDEFILSNSGDEININTNSTLSFKWLKEGAPQSGKTIVLSATRGDIDSQSTVTNSAGEASFSISSKTAGQTVITATSADGLSTSINREFVATTPAYLNTQASPTLIAPNTASTIIAKVRDEDDNPVKNKIIDFRLEDTVDGTLSASTATTDSLGRASVSYTAGNSSSSTNGVKISTFIQGYPSVLADDVSLTVGGNALRLVLGDDQLIASDEVFYIKQFGVIVTDSAGNSIAEKDVSFTINPTHYYKGFMRTVDTDGDGEADRWSQFNTLNPDLNGGSNRCVSEDFDQDGNLDIADGEDINKNGELEPTQEAVVTGTGKTDADGKIVVQVTYAKSSALWSRQRITAKTQVDGTEFVESTDFNLPILAADVENVDSGVPNAISPYGFADRCDTDSNSFSVSIIPQIIDLTTGVPVTKLANDNLYQISFVDVLGNSVSGQDYTINSTVVDISDEPNNSFRLTDQDLEQDSSGFFIQLITDGVTSSPLLYQDDAAVVPAVDTEGPILTLNGSSDITLTVGDVYTEQGANAVDLSDGDVVSVSIIGSVNTATTGVYTLIYTATDSVGNVSTVTRTVTVNTDATPPVLTLTGSSAVTLTVGDVYTEQGANAVDLKDGVVSVSIVGSVNTATAGVYTLTYSATDSDGNMSAATRTVTVNEVAIDTVAPEIFISGQNPVTITQGNVYTDAGATAVDLVDGAVTVTVVSGLPVDTSIIGTQSIVYRAEDSSNNAVQAVRQVEVVAPDVPLILLDDATSENNVFNDLVLTVGDVYFPNESAIDLTDGDVTVTVSGDVVPVDGINKTTTAGTYNVTYTAVDSDGNVSTATRTVIVNT